MTDEEPLKHHADGDEVVFEISLTDDYWLFVSHNKVPSELYPLFHRQLERIHFPDDQNLSGSRATRDGKHTFIKERAV
jgi:hypothetical protein